MKIGFLIIITLFLVLLPWIHTLDYEPNIGIGVDGIQTSTTIVTVLTIAFSLVSWFMLSWASKNIKSTGVPLSMITGLSLILPFMYVMGPMAAVIVGSCSGIC